VTIPDETQAAWAAENAEASVVTLMEGHVDNISYKQDSETIDAEDLVASAFNVSPRLVSPPIMAAVAAVVGNIVGFRFSPAVQGRLLRHAMSVCTKSLPL